MSLNINYSFLKKISREWQWGIVISYVSAIYAFLPLWVFDVRDIFMNLLSSGMGELFIAFVLRPNLTV
ncbi:MAG: hypothetical protein DYG83_17165 [Candidatus Brocadia sp. AMX2]|uniref:Flavoprotein n=1 Tax=Candidatus Brocadia sinica JPN1 TaxID=1197129 RepID=A0ABQ0K1J9_9BACT|nr:MULTISPECIES: hypothetical protein [Brocadia]MBC6933952.1 hypothetical protein [Candidatus Brocadia sp.]MBL1170022.1 hypothetical protein [Candidatus Brocadia sp. AMX1]NOG42450.1 hypothetical protein [Planctomycetota bacterium]KAA0241699.1 MAG: hypothetical protein EDM70_17190 [Candidatus Brocadia sp. AMX2]MCE7868506.1 hypothetical protein [Candidatus Brocadia sp. AMX2]